MLLTNVPSWALCIAMIAAVLELAAASHFRGAIIQWRPVDPGNFDGRVLFTHRIAWRRSSTEGGDCDASTVAAATLIGGGNLTCRIGCSGNIGSLQYQCTNFNVAEDWSAGEGSNEFNISGVSSFEASYTSCCWITLVQGGGSWEVRVKGDLTPRADNGRINSSPTTAVPPVLTLRHGATHTITIPVSDADGDIVRCKWAESALSECAGVCQVFPATLDQDNCTLTYNANGALGIYAVALQVEDFINASSTVAMSSVPFQFLVQIQEITIPPGVTDPTFVGTTPADGSSIAVGSSYQERITARSGGDNATIVDIITVFPPGLMRSNLTVLNSRESYIDVTWTPSPSQQGLNSFCYAAIDNFGLTSPTRCITLAVGVCEVNEYIHPTSGVCAACPTDSTLAGGTPSMCTCNAGTGRVNETDVTLPCLDCPGPPETPSLVSDVPPNVALSWSPPPGSGAWSYTYEVSWTNESVIVPRQAGTTGQIPGLQAETEYTLVITAYSDSTLCPEQSEPFMFMTSQRCPSSAPMVTGPPTVQPGVVSVNWTATGSSDPLVTGGRYALYSRCGAETTFQLIDDDIQGLSYDITTLPSLTQCVLRVVVYSDHCLLDVDGPHGNTTDNFTTVCEVNEYVHPSLGVCAACPTDSTSAGGTPSMCNCSTGTGRVNETDVTLPCLACPGPPDAPTLDSSVPPIVNLSWSPPSASGAWSYTYDVSWTNESIIVPRQAGTTGRIPGLQAETEYTLVITAYPDSTLCPEQSEPFMFMTTQRCPSPPPMFSGPPTVQPGVVGVSWTAAGSSDPLVTGARYALYSQCGADTTFQLIDDDIQGLSYDITTLPSLTQCVLRVVVYSDHCLLDVDGPHGNTTDIFTTVCPVNEYVGGSPETCQPCPAMSSSPGGVVRVCPCMDGYGRVNDLVPSLPCVVCPGPPLNPMLTSPVPPIVEIQWDRPTTPDPWSFMYRIDWQNGTSAVGDTTNTRRILSGLEAVTQYTVTISAFTDSTVCAKQSVNITFSTTQRCPDTGPQVRPSSEILPGIATVTWEAAQTNDRLLTTGILYAVYSLCGSKSSSYQLVAEAIEGLSYTVTGLPAPAQCALRVVAYHRYCLQDLDGVLSDETLPFTTAIAAPEQPPPPTITVGDGGFTIDGLGPMDVVVEYVCNYTSVITGETVQVRMKPNETADVSLEKVGGYVVQCAGVNGDNYQGAFSEPVTITVEPPETREGSPQRSAIDPLVVSLSVIGVAFAVTLLVVLVGAVIQAKIRCKKNGEQGDIPIESL